MFSSVLFSKVLASTFTLPQLTSEEVDQVIQDFGGAQLFTSVSPASVQKEVMGYEVGALLGWAKVPRIEDLAHKADPNMNIPVAPYGGLLGAVSFPQGFRVEVGFLPESEVGEFKVNYRAVALQWTPTQSWLLWPVEFALKLHRAQASIKYVQLVSGLPTHVDIDDTITGLDFIVSKNLGVIEPFGGLGAVKSEGEIQAAATGLFDAAAATSAEGEAKSLRFFAGVNLQYSFFKAGVELSRHFETAKATLKMSAAF